MVAARIALVVDFLNTVDADVTAAEPVDTRRVRDALRASIAGDDSVDVGVAVPVRIGAGGPVPAPTTMVQAVVAAALELAATGDWARIKLCPADDCREAFYDTSRNRSRVWCDMADCGNRAKVRTFRSR